MSMSRKFILVFLVTLCAAETFDQFAARFHKFYPNQTERAYRESIYYQNKAKIDQVNFENRGYRQKVNQFSDLTQEQAERAAGLRRIVVPQGIPVADPPSRKVGASLSLPLQVDWRTEGKVSAIKYQGTCGSCWAFTATGLYQSFLMIGGMAEPDLSEQYVLQCTTANSPGNTVSDCGGGILDYAIPFVVQTGIPTEADFPYLGTSFGSTGTPTTAGICSTTNLVKDTNLSGVYQGNYQNLTAMQIQDLVAYAPIAVAVYADTGFMNYGGGIYTGCPDFETSAGLINHAVILVGYDANGNYIIKNSWGTGWGEDGFGIISKTNDCALTYLPRQIRGTNTQLSAFHLVLSSILVVILMAL